LPEALRNHTFDEGLKDDATTSRWLAQLMYNISSDVSVGAGAVQGAPLSRYVGQCGGLRLGSR